MSDTDVQHQKNRCIARSQVTILHPKSRAHTNLYICVFGSTIKVAMIRGKSAEIEVTLLTEVKRLEQWRLFMGKFLFLLTPVHSFHQSVQAGLEVRGCEHCRN